MVAMVCSCSRNFSSRFRESEGSGTTSGENMRGVSRLLRKSPKPVEFGAWQLSRMTHPHRA